MEKQHNGQDGCSICGTVPEFMRRRVIAAINSGLITKEHCSPLVMQSTINARPWHGTDVACAKMAQGILAA